MPTEAVDADFDTRVLARSHTVPVLVDFWAAWCGPCRALAPTLETAANEAAGRFELVKVDTEAAPQTAARYRIRSIPAVKLFVGGEVVGEFVGALPLGEVRRFLDAHLPGPADEACGRGRAAWARGDEVAARRELAEALQLDPQHAGAHLALAEISLQAGDLEAVARHAGAIHFSRPEAERGERLQRIAALHEFTREADLAALQARVLAEPGDAEAQFQLGCVHALAQRWEPALEALLESIKAKRKHRDGAAQRAMVAIFGWLGHDDPRTDAYQRQLQIWS